MVPLFGLLELLETFFYLVHDFGDIGEVVFVQVVEELLLLKSAPLLEV